MNQNEPKWSNAIHKWQQRFTTSFSLPCRQPGRFLQSLYERMKLYLFEHFEDKFHFFKYLQEFKLAYQ